MRLSSTISLAVLALPILLHSPGALSAEPAKDPAASCGANSREAIAIAEKALTEKGSDSQARAMACVIAAIKALEEQRLDAVREEGRGRVLKVPLTK